MNISIGKNQVGFQDETEETSLNITPLDNEVTAFNDYIHGSTKEREMTSQQALLERLKLKKLQHNQSTESERRKFLPTQQTQAPLSSLSKRS